MVRRAHRSDERKVRRLWMDLLRSQAAIDDQFAPADDAEERWKNDFAGWRESESRRMFVAEDDGRVAGFITAERWNPPPVYRESPGVYVIELYVEPEFRRRGHATALVAAVREWAEKIGAQQIRAGVLARNEAGTAFWTKLASHPVIHTHALVLDSKSDQARLKDGIGFRL